jgi:hypothetical protein
VKFIQENLPLILYTALIELSETVFSCEHWCRFSILLNICFIGSKGSQDTPAVKVGLSLIFVHSIVDK